MYDYAIVKFQDAHMCYMTVRRSRGVIYLGRMNIMAQCYREKLTRETGQRGITELTYANSRATY